jgi:hypothetical protein
MTGTTTTGTTTQQGVEDRTLHVEVTAWRRVQGAVVTAVAGAAGMYAVLAGFAAAHDSGLAYPFRAVQAMISGRRVMPDHPVGSVRGTQVLDFVVAPVAFLTPALVAALATLWWVSRRRDADLSPRAVIVPAVVVTVALFAVLVLLLGFREADPQLQRISSGYGVRELGLPAWLLGHAVYAAVLTLGIGHITRLVSTRRRGSFTPLRGESPVAFPGRSG